METQAEDIGSTTQSTHPDPLVEHIILEVLGPSLSGRRYATKWLEAFVRFDCLIILDVITLSPRDIEDMGFSVGSRNLWGIFLSFIRDRATEDDHNVYNAPEFFLFNMTNDQFKSSRILTIQSRDTTSQLRNPRVHTGIKGPSWDEPRGESLSYKALVGSDATGCPQRNSQRNSPSPTAPFETTPIQRSITERTHNIPCMSSFGAFTTTVPSPSPTKSIQTINPIVKKEQKITDYPTFSGQQADCRLFERKFIAIANSQNYGHVLDLNFNPTPEQEDEYRADIKYIYQAFSVS